METKKLKGSIANEMSFDNFIKFLQDINYLSNAISIQNITNKKHLLEILDFQIDDLDNIGLNEQNDSNKKGNIENFVTQFKTLYNLEVDIPLLYETYKDINLKLNNQSYTFSEFHNLLKIMNFLMINFNDDVFKLNIDKVWEDNVVVFFTEDNEYTNTFREECNKVVQNSKSINELKEDEAIKYRNLLYLFYLFTICGKLSFNLPSSKIRWESFVLNTHIYNKFYISHLNYFLLIHFMMILLHQISLKEEINHCTSNNLFEKTSKKRSVRNSNYNKNIVYPTCYLLENISNKDFECEVLKVSLVINECKYYLFNYFTNEIIVNLKILNSDFFNTTLYFYEYKSNEVSNNLILNKNNLSSIKDLSFLNQNNFHIDEVLLCIKSGLLFYELQNLIKKYESTILKSRSLILKDNVSERSEYVTIESFVSELELVNPIVQFLKKLYSAKKKKKQEFTYFVQINFFYIFLKADTSISVMNSGNKAISKIIKFIINFSNLKEEELLKYLSQTSAFGKLYQSLKEILKSLQSFKKHFYHLFLSKEQFDNAENNFMVNLLALALQNHSEEKGYKNLLINEINKNINPKYSLMVSSIYKEKNKKNILLKLMKKMQNPTISVLNKFAEQLITYFSEIIINDLVNNTFLFDGNVLLRNFKNNKIILRNQLNNTFCIDIYLYDKLFYEKIVEFVKILKSDQGTREIIHNVTFVINKSFYEEIIHKEFSTSQATKILYSIVDKFYIISNSVEYDYDIYILEKRICIINHRPISQVYKNKLTKDHLMGANMRKIIFDFIRILLNCFSAGITTSGMNKNNSLYILLHSKERFFTHICLVYKSNPKSAIKMISLCDGQFSLLKIVSNNNSLGYLFNHEELFKQSHSYPKFSISYMSNKNYMIKSITSKRNSKDSEELDPKFSLSNLINPLEQFLTKIQIGEINNEKPNQIVSTPRDDNSAINSINIIVDEFYGFLNEEIFKDNYHHFLPIAFSDKYFFLFLKLCYNFYYITKGNLFNMMYIVPLDITSKPENMMKEFNNFYYSQNCTDYIIAKNVNYYETEKKAGTLKHEQEKEIMIYKGWPFSHSKIQSTLKLISSTYERRDFHDCKNKFSISGSYYIELFLFLTNSRIYRKLKIKKILLLICSFLIETIKFELYYSKKHLMEALIKEIANSKEEKTSKKNSGQLISTDKSDHENKDRKNHKHNKKCLIY